MTRQEAFKKLQKLFGKKALYRVHTELSSPEKRQQAREAMEALRAKHEDVKVRRDARQKELLADPTYQELVVEARALYQALDRARGEMSYYKFSIGTNEGFAYMVEAQGDTWEQCFEELERKKQSKAS